MAIIGGPIGYELLRRIAPSASRGTTSSDETEHRTSLTQAFGPQFFAQIQGKTVIDFGCGKGFDSVDMAHKGAAKVIGIDIRDSVLDISRQRAERGGVGDRCLFTRESPEQADVLISKDAFEHFADPAAILRIMATLVKPDGVVLASFGPTWLHPHGGHLFSVFPWSHLIFSEAAQIRWRSDFKQDGATRFSEVAGGLNQLTIAQFEKIVADSPFRLAHLDTVPIRGVSLLKTRALREFGSSLVRAELTLK